MLASSEGYSDTVHVLCMAGAQVDLQDKVRYNIIVSVSYSIVLL